MLKRENRIRLKKEFAEIKNKGRVLYSPLFGFLTHKENDDQKKFGFIVSKKISKKAVERNKIKRRVMEVLGKNLSRFNKGTRVLFLSKKEALKAKMSDFEQEIERLCLKK